MKVYMYNSFTVLKQRGLVNFHCMTVAKTSFQLLSHHLGPFCLEGVEGVWRTSHTHCNVSDVHDSSKRHLEVILHHTVDGKILHHLGCVKPCK